MRASEIGTYYIRIVSLEIEVFEIEKKSPISFIFFVLFVSNMSNTKTTKNKKTKKLIS